MEKKMLMLFILSCLVISTRAQWVEKNDGLYGGSISSLLHTEAGLFAGNSGKLFLSTNNGVSWTSISNGSFGVLAANATSLFAAGKGIFRSMDNGLTWVAANTGLTNDIILSLAVNGSSVFAGLQGKGVFVSTNNGDSWIPANIGLPANTSVLSFAVSGSNLFAGTYAGEIFLSNNNGQSWTSVSIPGLLSYSNVRALTVSDTKLFAVTRDGVYVSGNNGATWTSINTGLLASVQSLAVSGNKLVAGTDRGIFLSSNDGASWTAVSTGLRVDSWVTCLAVNGTNLFAGTAGGGVFRSTNDGLSWTAANTNLTTTSVYSLAINGSNLYAGTNGSGVFLSTNNGTSWSPASDGLPISENHDLVWSLVSIGTNLFAGTGDGVYLSTNNGTSWTPVNSGLPGYKAVAPLLVSGTNLFAGLFGEGVFLSTNNGTSWSSMNNGLLKKSIASLEAVGNNIFAGNFGGTVLDGGVFLSTDNGASWAEVSNGLPAASSIISLVGNGANVFAGTNFSGIYMTSNNGVSWTAVNSGLPANAEVKSLLVSGSNLFAGTGEGVFLSTNNGASWAQVNTGFTSQGILSLAINGSDLFAGTGSAGVWSRPLSDFSKKDQTISFSSLENKVFGDPAFMLSATANSSLPLSYTSSNTSVVTISGNSVTIVGAGSTTITVSQAGNSEYNPAANVQQVLSILPKDQTITFSTPSDRTIGDAAFVPAATASSNLPVSFESLTSGTVTVSGNLVTLEAPGAATIRARQTGNINFKAAPNVDRNFCVLPAKPAITLSAANTDSPMLTSNASTGNQWFFNGNSISGAINPILMISQPGVYTVRVTIEGCVSELSDGLDVVITGDIASSNEQITAYPNPSKDRLYIILNGFIKNDEVHVKLVDLNGKVHYQKDSRGGELLEISLAGFAAGVYLINADQGRVNQQVKIVKK
jgi:photosystem II stability/assembly factor-like uncharacterized protein